MAKYKRAVALKYENHQESAPTLSLLSEHHQAEIAVKIARRFNIPVIERPELVNALFAFELDSQIPEELFEAVAIILAELEKRSRRLLPGH